MVIRAIILCTTLFFSVPLFAQKKYGRALHEKWRSPDLRDQRLNYVDGRSRSSGRR